MRLYKKQRVESEFEKNIIPAEEASYGLDSPSDRKIYNKQNLSLSSKIYSSNKRRNKSFLYVKFDSYSLCQFHRYSRNK